MRLYIAGTYSRPYVLEGGGIKLYLAGEHTVKNGNLARWKKVNILESYYYCRKNDWVNKLIETISMDRFLLDSGAFTFMSNAKITVDWQRYTNEYADYINSYGITQFIEMDIDSVVGLPKVLDLRMVLENKTGKQCIPVWHKSRGKQNFIDMCKEYSYVAIGGLVTREIEKKDFKHFPWFINTAHYYGAKIHALGFTGLAEIPKYNFDSVDSTAWLYGNRGGYLYHFDGQTIKKIDKPVGTKLKSREAAMHNFNEWVKFGRYMENKD